MKWQGKMRMRKEKRAKGDLKEQLKNSRVASNILAAVLSFGGVCALFWMLPLNGEKEWLGYSNSIFSVFLFFMLFWLMKRAIGFDTMSRPAKRDRVGVSGKKSRWLLPGFLGILFSGCMIFGAQLDQQGSVPFRSGGMWISILILAVIAALLVRYFWDRQAEELADKKKSRISAAEETKGSGEEIEKPTEQTGRKRLRSYCLTAAVIFLCYLPVFLAVYPGFFVYDAQDEYLQVVTRNFSTHHPLLHVLLLGGIIQLVYKLTDSYNLGIACYTLFQMTVLSFIFAGCVETMKVRGMKGAGRILLTLYFGLCPVLVMFSLCSAKDGLFTGMLLIAVLLLQELCEAPERFFGQKGKVFLLWGASLFMMLLRYNGFYAFCVFAVICGWYLKKFWKRTVPYFLTVIVFYMIFNTALAGVVHADASENQEILTVPISQLARVYRDEAGKIPEEEAQILYRYLPREALEHYNPKVSDGVKIHFNNEVYVADKGSYLKLWLKWGAKHPFTYLNAWFMTSYGFWYPDTVIDVYRGNTVFTYTYEDSSYFGYEVEQPGVRESKIPWLDECYRRMSLEIAQQKIPVVSMLFSPGFLFWVMLFLVGFLCDQGRWKQAMPFLLPLLIWLTVILGPTYLVRYVVFLWVAVPVLVFTMLHEGEPDPLAKNIHKI